MSFLSLSIYIYILTRNKITNLIFHIINYRIANCSNVTDYFLVSSFFPLQSISHAIPVIILLNTYLVFSFFSLSFFLIVNWNEIKYFDYLSSRWVFYFTFELWDIKFERNGMFCIIYIYMFIYGFTYRYMMIYFCWKPYKFYETVQHATVIGIFSKVSLFCVVHLV